MNSTAGPAGTSDADEVEKRGSREWIEQHKPGGDVERVAAAGYELDGRACRDERRRRSRRKRGSREWIEQHKPGGDVERVAAAGYELDGRAYWGWPGGRGASS